MLGRITDVYSKIILDRDKVESFNSNYRHYWNECFQWVVSEQFAVYKGIYHDLAGLEMVAIFLSWEKDINIRGVISRYHDENPRPVYDYLEELIQEHLIHIYPHHSQMKYREARLLAIQVFEKAMSTFEYDPNFEFGKLPFYDLKYK